VSPDPEQIVLATREDVLAALATISRFGRRDLMSAVSVRLPSMAPREALRAQLRLNQAALDCGCSTGSAFMAVSAVLCVGYMWATSGSPLGADFSERLGAGIVVLAAAVIGKLFGIARARRRLIRGLGELAVIAGRPAEQGG
jgi:hypothetical protein